MLYRRLFLHFFAISPLLRTPFATMLLYARYTSTLITLFTLRVFIFLRRYFDAISFRCHMDICDDATPDI